jgi:pyrroline-5-carboxylate reductase
MSAIGVIGTGAMGTALVRGWVRCSPSPVEILVWDKVPAAMERALAEEGVVAASSLEQLVSVSATILVVVKPKDAPEVLGTLAILARSDQTVVSSMAGVTLSRIRDMVGPTPRVFRIMPNLGVELGVGAVAVAAEPGRQDAEADDVLGLFDRLGLARLVPEEMMDAVTAVSGSGPAFIALAVEALEDGAVAAGSSRTLARALVRQAALSEAGLLSLHSNSASQLREHLAATGELDEVGLATLGDRGVCSAFQDAVNAAVNRSRGSGGPNVSPR